MMMSSEEAIEYLKNRNSDSASQTEQKEGTDGGQQDTTTAVADKVETVESTDAGREPEAAAEPETGSPKEVTEPDAKGKETEGGQEGAPDKKKFSKQEKIDFAFKREKAKRKEAQAKADARIAELEAKLKKYSVLEQTDFDPNDLKSYIDHKLQLRDEEAELKSLKTKRTEEAQSEAMEEAGLRHKQQVEQCFGSQEEQTSYYTLLRNGGQKFREFLDEYDPDHSIDSYLDDCEISPVMIRALMTNPEMLKSVVTKRNPMNKLLALKGIENRLRIAAKLNGSKSQPAVKKPIPVLGSQVRSAGVAGQSVHKDWNKYLTEHP